MDEPDFASTPIDDLRGLALSRSAFASDALREMFRRAYDLPAAAPPLRTLEVVTEMRPSTAASQA